MLKKTKVRLGALVAAVAVITVFGGVAAQADPSAGTFKTLSGVGSDTIQDVENGMATVVPAIGSYDATGSATIQTKSGGAPFARPNGSGAGLNALSASSDGSLYSNGGSPSTNISITGQVDYARSSSGPASNSTPNQLTFIPFALDAVTFAVNAASDFPRDIPIGTAAQMTQTPKPFTLRNIYNCLVTSYTDANSNTVTIRPLLPQQGSGTRKFWLQTLGITDGASLPSCVTDIGNTVEEHNGTFLTGPGDIAPFSVAQWIAQGNWSALPAPVTERRGDVALGSIASVKPYTIDAGTGAVLNTDFPITRNVYNVVATSRLSDPNIIATFEGTSSAFCTNTAIIKKYGFGTLGSLCGDTTDFHQAFTQ
jgi:hypothetical protein